MSSTLLFIILMLFQQSISAAPTGCYYKASDATTISTDANYLTQSNDEKTNKQKCFDLSNTDVNPNVCCYYKDGDTQYCAASGTVGSACPQDSQIVNNCGMALYYQPLVSDKCTEISLVDGYCCYVQTETHGTACVRQDEIDEDDKSKIYDEMRNAVKKLKLPSVSGEPVVKSVVCEGNYMTYYVFSLLLLAVML